MEHMQRPRRWMTPDHADHVGTTSNSGLSCRTVGFVRQYIASVSVDGSNHGRPLTVPFHHLTASLTNKSLLY